MPGSKWCCDKSHSAIPTSVAETFNRGRTDKLGHSLCWPLWCSQGAPQSPFPSHSQIFDHSAVADFLGFLYAKVSNTISASEAGATPIQLFCYCVELNIDQNTIFCVRSIKSGDYYGGISLMPSHLADENIAIYCSHFTCSHFPFYLQKLLGRPSPVHIHLQAAVQKVAKHGRESLRVLQLRCPICSYQIQRLEERETRDSTCFFQLLSCLHRPCF